MAGALGSGHYAENFRRADAEKRERAAPPRLDAAAGLAATARMRDELDAELKRLRRPPSPSSS